MAPSRVTRSVSGRSGPPISPTQARSPGIPCPARTRSTHPMDRRGARGAPPGVPELGTSSVAWIIALALASDEPSSPLCGREDQRPRIGSVNDFVPRDFDVPRWLETPQFVLEPLGPEHNAQDYDAWTSSVDH